ncbi:ubiquinone biosynthesis accessory factor UbiJ [Thalassotalea ganghwensis]
MTLFMPQQGLTSAIELIIDLALSKSHDSVKMINNLEQQTLAVELKELKFPLVFTVTNNKVLVTGNTTLADCTVTTTLTLLKQLQSDNALTEAIKSNQLDVVGDLKVAQRFAALAESFSIDWQSELANYIGDVATYKVSLLAASLWKKANFVHQQIKADASEWLVHEKQLAITNCEYQLFAANVTDNRKQTDALSERILILEQRLNQQRGSV